MSDRPIIEMIAGRAAKKLLLAMLLLACSTDVGSPPPTATTQSPIETTTTTATTMSVSTTKSAIVDEYAGRLRLWSVDPATLSAVERSAIGRVGEWVAMSTVTEREVAFVAFGQDSMSWRLWLLDRETSFLTEVANGAADDAGLTGYFPYGHRHRRGTYRLG